MLLIFIHIYIYYSIIQSLQYSTRQDSTNIVGCESASSCIDSMFVSNVPTNLGNATYLSLLFTPSNGLVLGL